MYNIVTVSLFNFSIMASHCCYQRMQILAQRSTPSFEHVKTVGQKRSHPSSDRQIEAHFIEWACGWDWRVFQNKLAAPSELGSFFYNEHQHRKINKLVDAYHTTNPEQVGKDKFVWTCFACAIIKEHKRRFALKQSHRCRTASGSGEKGNLHRCFYVLLWISFHLRLPTTEIVEEILSEILICSRNLRFIFSFLPSMSLQLYMRLLWSQPSSIEEKLCLEFFSLFNVDMAPRPFCKDAFKLARPMLLYLVQHMSPLHRGSNNKSKSSRTLADIINRPILFGRKFTLLYIGVQLHDEDLVKATIERGASADKVYWDAVTESYTSIERLMVTSINALMGSHQFVSGLIAQPTDFMTSNINAVSQYAPLIHRSLFRSHLRKSTDTWSENSVYELNRQIADTLGIECKVGFPSLQHMCKINIRRQILKADNMLLTKAAWHLPLPRKLIKYINLELD